MSNYLTYEELPKNYRYYLDRIKELGVDDIRIISIFNHDTQSSIFYSIWIDTEDVVDGKVPNADIPNPSARPFLYPILFTRSSFIKSEIPI